MSDRIGLINAGNTNTVFGVFERDRIGRVRRRNTADWTVAAARQALVDAMARHGAWTALTIAAVVPRALERWRRAARHLRIPLLQVHGEMNPGVPMDYPRRATLGADRVANIAAAAVRWPAPFIVVDVGTATTIDVVSRDRGFVGGVILPGPRMLREALAQGAALLPRIGRSGSNTVPAVGRSTAEAMRIGNRVGYAGGVREVLARIRAQQGMRQARICFTGGAAKDVVRDLGEPYPVIPHLTLEGLARLYVLNHGFCFCPVRDKSK